MENIIENIKEMSIYKIDEMLENISNDENYFSNFQENMEKSQILSNEILRRLSCKLDKREIPSQLDLPNNFINSIWSNPREKVISKIGFALITKEFIKSLSDYIGDNKCLEIMAGKGAISKGLKDNGIDVIATDNYSWNERLDIANDSWTDIENIDCLDAIKKYGKNVSYVICSWIPYNSSIGYEALKLMNEINPDCKMIVIGEGKGGCTADDLFFEHLEYMDDYDFSNFKRWFGIHDYVDVVKYKKPRD